MVAPLLQISDVDDTEVFKIAVEFWLRLASSLYESETVYNPLHAALGMGMAGVPGAGVGMVPGIGGRPAVGGAGAASSSAAAAGFGGYPLGSAAAAVPGGIAGAAAAGGAGALGSGRLPLYAEVLARVREVMIRHMAKPEEVRAACVATKAAGDGALMSRVCRQRYGTITTKKKKKKMRGRHQAVALSPSRVHPPLLCPPHTLTHSPGHCTALPCPALPCRC